MSLLVKHIAHELHAGNVNRVKDILNSGSHGIRQAWVNKIRAVIHNLPLNEELSQSQKNTLKNLSERIYTFPVSKTSSGSCLETNLDIIGKVFSYLSIREVSKACVTNRSFYEQATFNYLESFRQILETGKVSINELNVIKKVLKLKSIQPLLSFFPNENLGVRSLYMLNGSGLDRLDVIALAKAFPNVTSAYLALSNENLHVFIDMSPQLQDITFYGGDDSILEIIAERCPSLQRLRIEYFWGGDKFSTGSFTLFAQNVPNLRTFEMAIPECPFVDNWMLALSVHCTDLRSINLSRSSITSEGLSALASGCRYLEIVDLSDCTDLRSEALIDFVNHCTRISQLNLSGCEWIDDEAIAAIAEHCPYLRFLNLSGTFHCTDASLQALSQSAMPLRKIDLCGSTEVTDEGITGLARSKTALESISLINCAKLTDNSVIALAENCPRITHINLNKCPLITSKGLAALQSCHDLQFFSNDFCDKMVDGTALWAIASGCPRLKEASITNGCRAMHTTGALAVGCPEFEKEFEGRFFSEAAHRRKELAYPAKSPLAKLYQLVLKRASAHEIGKFLEGKPGLKEFHIKSEEWPPIRLYIEIVKKLNKELKPINIPEYADEVKTNVN